MFIGTYTKLLDGSLILLGIKSYSKASKYRAYSVRILQICTQF